jgi:ATP-dependent exoDNAse (exonuclease V) beta subunit
VGFVSGALDLLYRDPETGDLVVADYKTDRVEGDDELATQAEAYASQARLYARAVREALDLPEPPRAELWFLWAGRVVAVDQR